MYISRRVWAAVPRISPEEPDIIAKEYDSAKDPFQRQITVI